MRFLKHTLLSLIIFSNTCFGKEFDKLFVVLEPIDSVSQIEKSINNSFNTMIYRLSGSDSPSNIWKIINAGNTRKNFIKSYSIKNIDNKSYLEVSFDKDLLIKVFKIDFLKIDTEGYEFEILQGAKEYLNKKYVLGLEVECEFFQLRLNQALFWDIKNYLEKNGYVFYDFLKIVRWEKDQYSEMGQPQITDALFLKNPEKLIDDFKSNKIGKDVILIKATRMAKEAIIFSIPDPHSIIRFESP